MSSKIEQRVNHLTHGHGTKKKILDGVSSQGSPHILLFHGPKFFWRERITIENYIYLHPAENVLEIVSYHADADKQMRLYCDYDKLVVKLDKEDIENKVLEKKEELRRKKKSPMSEEDLLLFATRAILTLYIELRLGITCERFTVESKQVQKKQVECERCKRCIKCLKCKQEILRAQEEMYKMEQIRLLQEAAALSKIGHVVVTINPLFETDDPIDFLIDCPDNVQPVIVTHHKKANHEGFNSALNDLKKDTKKLNKANDTALSLAGLAKSSVEGFQAQLSRMSMDTSMMSRAQILWKRAIKKVILQNAVANYTEQWERSSLNPMNNHTYEFGVLNKGPSCSVNSSTKHSAGGFPKLRGDSKVKSFSKFSRDRENRRFQSQSFAFGDQDYYSLPPLRPTSPGKRKSFDSEFHSVGGQSGLRVDLLDVSSSIEKFLGPNFVDNRKLNVQEFTAPRPSSRLQVNPVDIASARSRYSRQSFIHHIQHA